MGFTIQKFQSFLNATIDKTKANILNWERASAIRIKLSGDYDVTRSFVCSYAGGKLLLGYNKVEGKPYCLISPAQSLPYQIIQFDDAYTDALLLRLYNLVYSTFPSIESFMDAMINSTNDPTDMPF